MVSSQVRYYIVYITRSPANVVTIWINTSFLPSPVHSFFRAALVFLAGCCCRNTIDESLQPMHLESNASSFSIWSLVSSFLFIWRPVLKTAPVGINPDIPHQGLNLLLSLWSTARSQFWLPYVSWAFRALWKYEEHDPGNFFSLEREQSSTCQSVFLSADSHRGAAVCSYQGVEFVNNCDTF